MENTQLLFQMVAHRLSNTMLMAMDMLLMSPMKELPSTLRMSSLHTNQLQHTFQLQSQPTNQCLLMSHQPQLPPPQLRPQQLHLLHHHQHMPQLQSMPRFQSMPQLHSLSMPQHQSTPQLQFMHQSQPSTQLKPQPQQPLPHPHLPQFTLPQPPTRLPSPPLLPTRQPLPMPPLKLDEFLVFTRCKIKGTSVILIYLFIFACIVKI